LILERLEVGPLLTNCYIIGDEKTHNGAVIDPADEADRILERAQALKLDIKLIINTHAHGDHIGANADLVEATGAKLVIHKADAEALSNPVANLSAWVGFNITSPPPDRLVSDGDIIEIGSIKLEVLHTPGHTAGSISLLGDGFVFSGDTLFHEGVGRTDLPGGSDSDLFTSVNDILFELSGDTRVYPGHGEPTTIGVEKRWDPFGY